MTARDPQAALQAHYASLPSGTPLELDPVAAVAAARRSTKTKRRQRDWKAQKAEQRAKAEAALPLPYASLAGREQLTRMRVITEARSRLMTLRHMTKAGGDQFIVKLRGKETAIVETWKTRELFRIDTKDEARPKDVGDNCAALNSLANADTRRRTADRYLKTAERLEAAGVWKPFSLLAA